MKQTVYMLANHTRKIVYISLHTVDKFFHKNNNLFVLCYHSVSSDSWRFGVSLSELKKQIQFINKSYRVVSIETFQQLLKNDKQGEPSVLITFDDGYKDILKIKDFFKKENIKPVLFLLSDRKHANRQELATNRDFLTTKEIKELIKAGWAIGSHSKTHANLNSLSKSELEEEIIGSKKSLEKELGIPIRYFAYPRGKYTQQVLSVIKKAGYSLAFTMDDGVLSKKTDKHRIPRVGIDRSHTLSEFKSTFSPSVVRFRELVKSTVINNYL